MGHPARREPDYLNAARHLKQHWYACQLQLAGCTGRATTLDHQPRLMDHEHVRRSGCCSLAPACAHCNSSDGASAGNRRRGVGYSWP